jgi:hypothetical protein
VVNVVCMKWGAKYGPHYVNRLFSMVTRHLARPHRFVCFTDDSTGVRADVETLTLPPMRVPGGRDRGWRKLSTFAAPLADLHGPVLFLDLDVVIVSSIDGFFEHPGAFCIIKDWAQPWRRTGNSSVYRFEAGAHAEILERFVRDTARARRGVANEQEYLTREMRRKGALSYWPRGWCVSFRYGCVPRFPASLFAAPKKPEDAKIIVFHGVPKPEEALGRAPWIAEHWR